MKRIKTYLVELILILSATVITGVSLYLHLENKTDPLPQVLATQDSKKTKNDKLSQTNDKIHIDVSGAVVNPDLYEATSGSRLKNIIDLAGGLSDEADKLYIARNFNMSKFVNDQEKIYIPYTWDIDNGTFIESPRILEYLHSSDTDNSIQSTTAKTDENGPSISLNDSTLEELDSLPGIGPVTAQKIIDNRPYSTTEDLLTKKIVKTTVFEEIKSLISL